MHLPLALPPWTTQGKKIESMVRKAIYTFQMLEGSQKISIALSGGKDSLTLLFLLKALSGHGFPELEIHAINVDGEFSCGAGIQTSYLKKVCEKLDVPLHVLTSTQKRETLSCYSCSRERRKLLFDKAKELNAPTIAFGHHRDDSIQTLLMNLLHKGEFAANQPKIEMQHYGVTIIRPMIYVSEKEIERFADYYGFRRITCQCPVGQNSMRKKTDQLLALLEENFPNARTNLSQAGLNYGSDKALNP
ncbi:MAG: tRNA 2-thiocytidine biosynthesis protein TtcA [Parachlamydiales bacterium]|nr:tRNA 2-thiocytidine biosynthesis protein TtcA [Parachlamydiales bacterium]